MGGVIGGIVPKRLKVIFIIQTAVPSGKEKGSASCLKLNRCQVFVNATRGERQRAKTFTLKAFDRYCLPYAIRCGTAFEICGP